MNRRAPVRHQPPPGETPGREPTADGLPSAQTLREVIDWLAGALLERDDHARVLLLALLSGEHVLLIGPPGTAKSALARRVHELVGGRWFERLVTRFTVPEELFGPLSLSALDEGRYERQTDAYLPTADVAFLDEVFKANSAILNALLGILNERVFDQGAQRVAVPLACLVAAANELPDDDGMRAFQDRFLFRCDVSPVADASFRTLLTLPAMQDEPPAWRFSRAVTASIDQLIGRVSLSDSLIDGLVALRANLKRCPGRDNTRPPGGGKSGLHRARWWLTATVRRKRLRGNPGTGSEGQGQCNRKHTAGRVRAVARVKWWGGPAA